MRIKHQSAHAVVELFFTSNSTVRMMPFEPSPSLAWPLGCDARICSSLPLSGAPLSTESVVEYWLSWFEKLTRSLWGIDPRGCPCLRDRDWEEYPSPEEGPSRRGKYLRMKGLIAVTQPPKIPRFSSMMHHKSALTVAPVEIWFSKWHSSCESKYRETALTGEVWAFQESVKTSKTNAADDSNAMIARGYYWR
jgi:hypothetical protein